MTRLNQVLHAFGLHMLRYYLPRPKAPPYAEDVFGHRIYQNIHDIIDYSSLSHVPLNRFDKWNGEIGFCVNEVKPGQTVIDIGANVGLFTLLLAKLVNGGGHVFAFEPGPVSFALLSANVLVNGYQNVALVNKAVAATTGVQKMYVYPGESSNELSTGESDFGAEAPKVADVETVSLDDYFAKFGGQIDYIKIDIQGGEYFALRGMQHLIERNEHIRLTIEYCPYLPSYKSIDIREFLSFLRSFGFLLYDLGKRNPLPVADQYLLDTYHAPGQGTTLLLQKPQDD